MNTTPTLAQQNFLEEGEKHGVNSKLFGKYIPEIQFQEDNSDPSRPTIAYIHTGGTLAMAPSVTQEGAISFENAIDLKKMVEVCDFVAGIRQQFNTIGIFMANIDSKEIRPDAWTAMASTIKSIYHRVDGVVVGHGTHTLEYSAAATAYALRNLAIPVVFSASQIPSVGFCGSDGIPNLTGAMKIAAEGDFAEVIAYANGTIHRGTRVTKEHDSRLNIFDSKITGPIGHFGAAGIEVGAGARRRSGKRKHELLFQPKFNPAVPGIKINPSITPDILQGLLQNTTGSVAAVLETYGSAALRNDLVPVLQDVLKEGTPIFLTSSAGQSGVSEGMDDHDEDAIRARGAGIRNAKDMTTSAATTKLMHIMGQKEVPEEPAAKLQYVEEEMTEKSYAGEVTIRQQVADF